MEGADNSEHKQGAGADIAGKKDEENEETYRQHTLSVEAVDNKSTYRTDQQRGYNVAREHYAYRAFVGVKLVVEIYRQQRGEEIEGEKQKKIACHHLKILVIPKLFRDRGVIVCGTHLLTDERKDMQS